MNANLIFDKFVCLCVCVRGEIRRYSHVHTTLAFLINTAVQSHSQTDTPGPLLGPA